MSGSFAAEGPNRSPGRVGGPGARADDIAVSFEFFPPKTEAMQDALWRAVRTLEPLGPRFFAVTYGAGGSTRERTHATVARLAADTGVPAAAHLTCVDASRDEVDEVARRYWAAGVRHVVALRGDPPRSGERFEARPDGYASAAELVAGLKRLAPFEITVAAFPEKHPESPDLQADLDNLRRKVDAGATRATTQFFFEAETFLRYRDRVAAAGIVVELLPGIMPVVSLPAVLRMAAVNGTRVPGWLGPLFEGLDEQPGARQLVAGAVATELCRRLHDGGVRQFHFYTLNRAELALGICRLLGLRAGGVEPARAAA